MALKQQLIGGVSRLFVGTTNGDAPGVVSVDTSGTYSPEGSYAYKAISTAATTVVKASSGILHSVVIAGGTLGAVTVYDNTAGSGAAIVATFTPTAPGTLILDVAFGTGLTIVTAAATVLTVSYL